MRFFSDLYGEYPFNAAGAIVDDATDVGYALETQTKPIFEVMPDEWTLVHETAHMWYGDSVTLKDWPDIWLNEGFATWSNWIWSEKQGNKTAPRSSSSTTASRSRTGSGPTDGRPGRRPPLRLGADLPARCDDAAGPAREGRRRRLLRHHADVGGGEPPRLGHDARSSSLLAEQESGMDLDDFFQVWLYDSGRPAAW